MLSLYKISTKRYKIIYNIMEKTDFKLISFRLPESVYDKLVDMQTDDIRSVSAVIRDIINKAINTQLVMKPIELKPLANLENSHIFEEVKKAPLEIPVLNNSPVIESVSLIRGAGRKIDPAMLSVMLAKRAKSMGRPYDVNMEQYFYKLDGPFKNS